jgi:hypothetical protein
MGPKLTKGEIKIESQLYQICANNGKIMGYTFEAEHRLQRNYRRNQIIQNFFTGFDFSVKPFLISIFIFMNLCLFIR